jgi:hypothetical protein
MRHSLSARGVKTKVEKKSFIGSRAKPLQKREAKPMGEMMEQDPDKKWLWGVKLKPKDKIELVRDAVRLPERREQPQVQNIQTVEINQPPEKKTKPSAFNPKTLESQATTPDKSKKTKYASVDEAWEAAQNEINDRYGGDSTGVVKDDDEQDRRLAKNMGLR